MSKLYAIYIRVSTREQGNGEGKSPKNQEHRCRAYINSQSDDPREEKQALIFRDIGHSGKDLERPAFMQMMKAVERGEIHTIIFTELSRISRSVMDFLNLVEQLNDQGVNFISIKEQYNTSTAIGRLLMTMIMALNAFEREQVSERTRAGIFARSERGLWNGKIPLGYRAAEERGYLEVVDAEAELVREIYTLYDQLGTISAVEQHLLKYKIYRPEHVNMRGKTTPAHPFRDSSIRRILTTPTYLGYREVNKKNKNVDQETLPEDQRYKLVLGLWEPIVEPEIAERVRARLDFNRERRGIKRELKTHDFILNGYLYCEECGECLEKESAKGNRYYYYKHPKAHATCSRKRWRAEDVEMSVFSHLLKLADEDEVFKSVVDHTHNRREALARPLPPRISELKMELAELKSAQSYLFVNLKTKRFAELPLSMLDESTHLETAIKRVEDELKSLNFQLDNVKPKREEVRSARERLLTLRPTLLNSDRYQMFKFLESTIGHIELSGDYLRRVTLLNTPKVSDSLSFLTPKNEKRSESSSQTATNLRQQDSNL